MTITCEGIEKRFGALQALDGVTMTVGTGEILGVAGPNGAGKTTLFDVLSGHVGADAGRIELDGTDVTSEGAHRRARLGLARTFQTPIVPTEMEVGEVLDTVEMAWPKRGEAVRSIDEVCDLVGFDVPRDRKCAVLDTLGRRKLLLACLLVHDPKVLMLDEPCSGLLADEVDEMEAIIGHVREATGVAIIVIEHRLELLSAISHRILVLDRGRIIIDGEASEVFADPVVQAAYFKTPGDAAA